MDLLLTSNTIYNALQGSTGDRFPLGTYSPEASGGFRQVEGASLASEEDAVNPHLPWDAAGPICSLKCLHKRSFCKPSAKGPHACIPASCANAMWWFCNFQ